MKFPNIPQLDLKTLDQASKRLDSLTKPIGSLGRLEELAKILCAMTGRFPLRLPNKLVLVMASDHGVTEEGVSAYPSEVTAQMVSNFLGGGAAINVLARLAGASVHVVDIGVKSNLEPHENLTIAKIAPGTNNIARQPAMTRQQAEEAIQTGIDIANKFIDRGIDVIATGEMGIGNTTPSSAITAVMCNESIEKVTGRGTGLDDKGMRHKQDIIRQAIETSRPNPDDPIDVLSKIGGFEIAGLAGVIIGCASKRTPVVIDGFISGTAALVAHSINPLTKNYMVASHCSVESGHRVILGHLGLKPLFDLDLRLGEGTGSALAFSLIDASLAVISEMATFESANVSKS